MFSQLLCSKVGTGAEPGPRLFTCWPLTELFNEIHFICYVTKIVKLELVD